MNKSLRSTRRLLLFLSFFFNLMHNESVDSFVYTADLPCGVNHVVHNGGCMNPREIHFLQQKKIKAKVNVAAITTAVI